MRRETPQQPERSARRQLGEWLEKIALFGLLLIIAMRPLISETYDSSLPSMERVAGSAGSLTPATTAAFDLGILLGCLIAAVGFALQGFPWPWRAPAFSWLLLLIAAIVSTVVASNKRVAANASSDWLITALIALVLPVLCRDRWRVGLLLSVIVASGITSLAKDSMQWGVEFRETREVYFQNKIDFWSRQNVPLDDPRVELYERRLRGTATSGFFPHSNVQAALLVLCGFAAMGLAGLIWSARPARNLCVAIGLVLLASTALTASKGGVLAAMVGLAILGGGWLFAFRGRFEQNRFVIWVITPLIACLVLAFIYGSIRGGLPGSSLQFRWQYWQTSAPIIKQHLLTGVGAQNFDRAYLLHKPIEYPEEIKDPHNFIVSILAQWGLFGVLGLLSMLVSSLEPARAPEPLSEESISRASTFRWTAALIVGFVLLRCLLLRSYWTSSDDGGQALVFFDLGLYGVVWAVSFAGLLWLFSHSEAKPVMNNWARVAIFAGVIAFLLHNLIEFSLFYPGTLTVFAALGGAWLATRQEPGFQTQSQIPAGVFALLLVVFVWIIFVPALRSSALLTEARSGRSATRSKEAYRGAVFADTWDPTAAGEWAELLARDGELGEAVGAMREAVKRDPRDKGFRTLLAQLLRLQYEHMHETTQLQAAIESMRDAVALYPNSPDDHAAFAELLTYSADQLRDPQLATQAKEEYQTALKLDAARPGTDEVRRWSAKRRAGIEEIIATLHQPRSATATNRE